MLRWIAIAVVLASCAKKSKDAAPASTAAEPTGNAAPAPVTTPTPPPEPAKGGEGGPTREEALAAARNGAILGPTAPTSAFDPIDGSGAASAASAPGNRRGATRGVGGTAPGGGGDGAPAVKDRENPLEPSAFQARIGAITADGNAAPKDLAQAIRVRSSEVQACYDTALAGRTDLVGNLTLTFTLHAGRIITDVAVKATTLKNVALESCVVGVLQKIQLPKSLSDEPIKGSVAITFAKRK